MATVDSGRVVIFGAGGPVGAVTMEALKDHYTLRCTDLTPLDQIVAQERRQSPRAPLPPLLPPPHERAVVDVTSYDQVLEACRGMDAAIDVTVLRDHPEKAFTVNTVGAFHVARATAECGLKRLIHTGPFHTSLNHAADSWLDHDVPDEIPLHPGDDLYALTKYLGGRGVGPFTVSWEDTGRAMLHGLRAPAMPSPCEVFLICAEQPHRKYRVDKARRPAELGGRRHLGGDAAPELNPGFSPGSRRAPPRPPPPAGPHAGSG